MKGFLTIIGYANCCLETAGAAHSCAFAVDGECQNLPVAEAEKLKQDNA